MIHRHATYNDTPVMDVDPSTLALNRKKTLFFILAVFCVAIPGFASLKALLILFTWAFIIIAGRVRLGAILWFLSVVLNLFFCAEIALLNSVPLPDLTNHLSRFILFFLILGIGLWLARSGSFKARTIDRLILTVSLLSAIGKVAILGAIASGITTFDSVQEKLGFESVTDSIGFGIQRLQFPSDIVLVFLLACYTGKKRKADVAFLTTATVSIFLSFSRFLLAAYVICLLIRYLRVRKLDLISISAIGITTILLGIFSVSLATRFGGEGAQASDNTRTEQIRYLTAAIQERSLLGSGIGSGVNGYKRSEAIPFSYEVQWYAMTMQLGAIGLSWFLLNLILPLIATVNGNEGRILFLAVFCVWIIGGFTNPFIISLGSAFGLSILVLTFTTKQSMQRATPQFASRLPQV